MRLKSLLLGLTALPLLASCATYDPKIKNGSADRPSYDIDVVEDTMVLEVVASEAEPGLPYYQMNRVKYFLQDYAARGKRHGPLVISVPQGSPYGVQFENGIREALNLAYEYGIKDISRSDYDSNGSPEAPMVLAFTAYRAIAPNCPSMASVNLAGTKTNDAHPGFGCAMQANLAAMIADPADLLGTRRADPADTLRRAEVLTKYRAGQSTATERTEQETGAVSTAVE